MAEQPLRSLLQQVEAGAPEVADYRRRLAARLDAADRQWYLMRRPLLLVSGAAALAVVAVVITLAFLMPRATPPALPQLELAELEALAATPSAEIVTRARVLLAARQPRDRCNALMLLCLTEPDERAVRYAAQGVQEDPRPEFRFFYLELLLDRADEYPYNLDLIEKLMDREPDRSCRRMLRSLLHLAT
jgi:hypothetical protein